MTEGTVRDKGASAAQSVENEFSKPKDGRDMSAAIDEIKAARGNTEFMEAFNAKLADNENAVPMLSGFKLVGLDAENEMVFEDDKHHRYELDAQGNRVDVWGDPGHDREFAINTDGSATHEVKKGDHIWGITKDMLREKLGREPNNQEVADAVKVVVDYNQKKGNITDPNHIEPGNHIDVPPEYVKDVKKQRGESWAGTAEDGRTTEVALPDGRTRTIERDEAGKVNKVTEKDASGAPVAQWTRNQDGTWTVTNKDGTVVRKMNAEVEADQEGNIKITHKNGNVEEFRANGQHVVTTKDGDVYEERADGWYKKGKDQQDFAKVDGGIAIDADGQVKEGGDAAPPPPSEGGADSTGEGAADGAKESTQAKAFSVAPSNEIYSPIAPPGLCEGDPDLNISALTAGPDGGNFDVEKRTVTKMSVDEAKKQNFIPSDIEYPPGAVVRIYSDGKLDGTGFINPDFNAIQVTDADGHIIYNRVTYTGDTKKTMWIKADNMPGGSVYGEVDSIETRYDAATGEYTTTITRGEHTTIVKTDKTGTKSQKV